MATQFAATLRNARLDQIATTVGANGHLIVYTGAAPGVGNAATRTKLSTLTGITFASASGGTKTFTATSDTNAAGTGTPGYVRLTNTAESTVYAEFDAAIGSGTVNFASGIVIGGTVSLTSATFTEGNS